MKLPWKKDDPIEMEKQLLAEMWANEEDEYERQKLIERYVELDNHQLEAEKVKSGGKIDAKTLFNGGITVGLALLTLNFEKFEILRSKASNLWLRRRD
jgi:hypothetical protein